MDFRHVNYFFLIWGILAMLSGIRSMITRKAVSRSKFGRTSSYVGAEAMWLGFLWLVAGTVVAALSLRNS